MWDQRQISSRFPYGPKREDGSISPYGHLALDNKNDRESSGEQSSGEQSVASDRGRLLVDGLLDSLRPCSSIEVESFSYGCRCHRYSCLEIFS